MPEGPPARLEVETAVRRELEEEAVRRFTRTCVDRLAAEVGVDVLSDQLWFHYRGRYAEASDGSSHRSS